MFYRFIPFPFHLKQRAELSRASIKSEQTMKPVSMISVTLVAMLWAMSEAADKKSAVQWEPERTNVTVTAEATVELLVKNFDESGDLHGSLRIALFGETVPMTVLNFFSICNGIKRPSGELKYAGTQCHRLIPDMNFQCGDTTTGDGTGGISMYGDTFYDENFEIGFSERGTIGMANRGPNSNGSQFFITFRSWQFLDNIHVGFGQVIGKESLEFLKKLSQIDVEDNGITPKKRIKIVDCHAKDVKKYKLERRVSVNNDKF